MLVIALVLRDSNVATQEHLLIKLALVTRDKYALMPLPWPLAIQLANYRGRRKIITAKRVSFGTCTVS